MREVAEFRIPEDDARRYLPDTAGIVLGGSVRKISVLTTDPLFQRIGLVQREMRSRGTGFFTAWRVDRSYTKREFQEAEAFQMLLVHRYEHPAEVRSTLFDETMACSHCGVGGRQLRPLRIPKRRNPVSWDVAGSFAGQWVLSRRAVDAFRSAGLTGFDLAETLFGADAPESDPSRTDREDAFSQLLVSSLVEIGTATRAGNNPFDDDPEGEYRCPEGHTLGLNLLTELCLRRDSWNGSDLAATTQHIGDARGAFRPARLLVASPRARDTIVAAGLRGMKWERVTFQD